jgi:hypothetical protein
LHKEVRRIATLKDNDEGENQAISCVYSSRDVYNLSLPGKVFWYNSKKEDSKGELENNRRDDVKRHESQD